MKIDVSQPGRQHTHLLLKTLERQGILGKFYTVFASNKLGVLTKVLHGNLKAQLRKRFFAEIPNHKIAHYPKLFLNEKFGKITTEVDLIEKVYEPFDQRVSKSIKRTKPDILIAYENANVNTFKAAKQHGITTVLDLAQIHHGSIEEIHEKFGFLDHSYTPEVLDFINSRKTEALK